MLGFQLPSRRMWREFDWPLVAIMFALIGFGLLTLYGSTSKVPAHAYYPGKQMKWIALGSVALIVLLFVDTDWLRKAAPFLYAFALGLLIYVLTSDPIKGARSWIRLGGNIFQPSEPTKIVVVLMLARVLVKFTPLRDKRLFPGIVRIAVVLGIPLALVAIQPDLGTAAIFVVATLAMLWVARIRRRLVMAIFLWGVLAGMLGYNHLEPYQRDRITTFMHPERDPLGRGYQPLHARTAQGSGMFFGKGFGQGTQTELAFLPDYQTDFIFSSLGEQFGFAGSIAVIALFGLFLTRAYGMARYSRDLFGAYAIVGLTTIIATHVVLNLGMSLGLLPVMGLPLPFFSYGGSFMLTNFLIVGLILNIRMRRYFF